MEFKKILNSYGFSNLGLTGMISVVSLSSISLMSSSDLLAQKQANYHSNLSFSAATISTNLSQIMQSSVAWNAMVNDRANGLSCYAQGGLACQPYVGSTKPLIIKHLYDDSGAPLYDATKNDALNQAGGYCSAATTWTCPFLPVVSWSVSCGASSCQIVTTGNLTLTQQNPLYKTFNTKKYAFNSTH